MFFFRISLFSHFSLRKLILTFMLKKFRYYRTILTTCRYVAPTVNAWQEVFEWRANRHLFAKRWFNWFFIKRLLHGKRQSMWMFIIGKTNFFIQIHANIFLQFCFYSFLFYTYYSLFLYIFFTSFSRIPNYLMLGNKSMFPLLVHS